MYPSELTITPEPRLRSLNSRGIGPKKRRKSGSSMNGYNSWVLITRDEEMLTTEGTTFLAIGANVPLNGTAGSPGDAAVTVKNGTLGRLPNLRPAAPLITMTMIKLRIRIQSETATRRRNMRCPPQRLEEAISEPWTSQSRLVPQKLRGRSQSDAV